MTPNLRCGNRGSGFVLLAMPLRAQEAAKKLCRRSGWSLSNLELQKLLYLAQLRFKRDHPEERLINTSFQAWDLGPMSPEVYHRAKVFGSEPVRNIFHAIGDEPHPLDKYLYGTFDKLADKTPAQLVAITHRDGGAWATYYRPGIPGITIPDAAIVKEARRFSSP